MRYQVGDLTGGSAGGSLLPSKAAVSTAEAFRRNALMQSTASAAARARVVPASQVALRSSYLATPVTSAPNARAPGGLVLAAPPSSGPRAGGFSLAGGSEGAPSASSSPSGASFAADAGSFGGGDIRDPGNAIAVTALPGGGGGGFDPGVVAQVAPTILPALTQKLSVPTLPQSANGPSTLEWAGIGAGVLALAVGAYFLFR